MKELSGGGGGQGTYLVNESRCVVWLIIMSGWSDRVAAAGAGVG